MSQVQSLFDGYSKIKKKESEAMNGHSRGISGPGVKQAGIHDLKNVPGVQIVKRKKK